MPTTNPLLPATYTAIIQDEGGNLIITPDLPLPRIEPHHILVKTKAVTLNPCDYKLSIELPSSGTYHGNDFSGVVLACCSAVAANGQFKVNDRVFGAVYGSNPVDKDTGSYSEYTKSIGYFTWKMPDWMYFEEAAAMNGTCIATMGVALFKSLELPGTFDQPAEKAKNVLIYGGSSSVKKTKRDLVMGPTILGAGVDAGDGGSEYAKGADPELRRWGIESYQSIQRLVQKQQLRVHPIRVLEGRFEAILHGLQLLKLGEVSRKSWL
ncbi:MAG: hypothetical protein Q9184_006445 [Pyrenodesmia sp. 2 TL-2023]